MKKFLFLLLPLACMLAGCKYDDSKVWAELNAQKAKIESLESLNSNVSSLQSIVAALQKNITVTAIRTTDKGQAVSFSDGTTVTILSTEALIPQFGAKQDYDGNYYWTVGGNWLLDASGKKVSTGETPKLKIEDDQWFVSYDDGNSWVKVEGQASSVSLFESVVTDANNAIFTLSDGSVITLPLANAANKLQLVFNESVFEKMRNSEVLSTSYKIIAPEGAKTEIETFESNGWTVTIYPTDETSGRISIKSPANVTPSKIMFLLTDEKGGSFVKIINIGFNEEAKPAVRTDYIVDPDGGELVIPITSCTAELSEDAEGWVEVVEAGDQVILNIQSNESYDYRNCTITLEDGTVVSLRQVTRDALVLSSNEVQIDGRRQKVAFVVSTNIVVTATVTEGSDWLSVDPTTKALTDKVFTFTATRNTTEAERTATVVFSGNDLTETCTVIQAPYTGGAGIDVTEAVATEEGEDIELEPSLVTATTTNGFVITDGESAAFVNAGQSMAEIGDSVSFKALTGTLNGITDLESISDLNVASSGNKVTYPSATDITKNLDSYSPSTAQYVTVTGDMTVENGTCSMTVPGASTKVVVYNPNYELSMEALDGHNVTVEGYWYGSTDGTAYIIATKRVNNGTSAMTITQVIGLDDETQFEAKNALVVAQSTQGIIVSDGTSAAYLYHGTKISVSAGIGDIVSIKGTKTTYNGVPEITISSASDVTVSSSGNPVSHPEATNVTSTFDDYSSDVAEYVSFTGDLVKSGNYYNITVAGASAHTGSISYPINDVGTYISGAKLESLSGHNVTVKGYFNGFTGSDKYLNIILTEITDNGASQGGGEVTPGGDDTPIEGSYTYTFESGDFGSADSPASSASLGGVNWSISYSWRGSAYFNFDTRYDKGLQIGSAKNSASELVLSTSGISGTIKSITVTTAGASGINATLSVSVGDSDFGSKSLSMESTSLEFTGSGSGTITLTWDNASEKALYIKAITIETE